MVSPIGDRMLRMMFFLSAICLLGVPAHGQYSGGTGEPNDPYQIARAEDLIALGANPSDYDKHFELAADIDLSGHLFDRAIIGYAYDGKHWEYEGMPFSGNFDGGGHVIRNLTIHRDGYLGLIGATGENAVVYALGLEEVNIDGTAYFFGGIVAQNMGCIKACYSTGLVTGGKYVGGLVGKNYEGSVVSSYSTAKVTGNQSVGGLVGYNDRATVSSSYSAGEVDCLYGGGTSRHVQQWSSYFQFLEYNHIRHWL